MNMHDFAEDLRRAVDTIKNGGIILYPTDTIWGIGCDATNNAAVRRIFQLKKRAKNKSMIILVSDVDQLFQYVDNPSALLLEYVTGAEKPTTAIYHGAKNLPAMLLANDSSVAIRIPADDFCQQLIKGAATAIVSTSANISGQNPASQFEDIPMEIQIEVDYIAEHRRHENLSQQASAIVRLNEKGEIERLR